MSTSSSTTSTDMIVPEKFGENNKFSHRNDYLILIASTIFVTLLLWTNGPKIMIVGLELAIIYAISGLSLNYQAGLTGIVNFGVVGFFAIGAYAVALATLLGWNWFPALIIGILVTVLISYLIARSTLKLREDYFAIITITLGEVIRFIFQKEGWIVYPPSKQGIWGGPVGLNPGNPMRDGLSILNIFNFIQFHLADLVVNLFNYIRTFLLSIGVPHKITIYIGIPNWYGSSMNFGIADLFSINEIDGQNIIFTLSIVLLLLLSYYIFEKIYNSPLGRLNKAIREDDLAVESTGEDIFKRKINVFVIGNVLIALAGGVYGYYLTIVTPIAFLPIFTFYIWAVVVLGGVANNRGVILGALIFGASFPLVTTDQIKGYVQGFFGSLINPIIPSLLSLLTDFINPGIKTWTNTFSIDLTWLLNVIINPWFNFKIFGLIIPLSTLFFLIPSIILGILKILEVRESERIKVQLQYSYFKRTINALLGFFIFLLILNIIITPPMTFVIRFTFTTLFLVTNFLLLGIIAIIYFNIKVTKQIDEESSNNVKNLFTRKNKLKMLKITLVIFVINFLPVFKDLVILPDPVFDNRLHLTGMKFVPLSTFFTTLDPELARIMAIGIVIMLFLLIRPEGVLKEKQIVTVDCLQEYALYYKSHINSIESELKLPKTEFPSEIGEQDNLLTTKGLTKNFGGVVGLDKVSVTIKRGSLLGIIGPNGSGKSTFFNVLTGLLEQDKNEEGKIEFLKNDITYFSVSERAKLGMGRTFQQSRMFKNLTVLENVLVYAKNQKGTKLRNVLIGNWKKQESEIQQQAFEILQYLNILHIWNQKASDISGGQQKLVALARALMSQSHIILLDEPVAGVNPTLAKKIFEKIQELHKKEGTQYVIIEHNMDVQLSFCDQIVVFNKGQIVAEGTPEDIRKNESVLDAYLGH